MHPTIYSCFLFMLSLLSFNLSSQDVFQKFYGTPQNDEGYSLLKLSDGNLLLACATAQNNSSNRDILLIKIDDQGNEIWSTKCGGANDDFPRAVIQTSDLGLAVVGSTYSFGFGGEDVFLVKLGSNGNVQWSKTYGGFNEERGFSLQQTIDGGFIIGGTTQTNSNGNADVFFVKTNASGVVEWSRSMGGGSSDNCFDIKPTSDGGFIFTGAQASYGTGPWDYWLVKITASGNLSWAKAYGGFGEEHSRIVHEANDGGFIIMGHTTSWGAGGWDILMIKTDENGNEQWSKVFGGSANEFAGDFAATGDAYYMATFSESYGNGRDFLVMKIDNNGNLIWGRNIGFVGNDILPFGSQGSIIEYDSESLYMIGKVDAGQLGGSDIFLLKIGKDGNSSCGFENVAPQSFTPTVTTVSLNIGIDDNNSFQNSNFQNSSLVLLSEDICPPPIADFTPSDTIICEGECIAFLDHSLNDPDSWVWNFQGGIPSFSLDQNPVGICFNESGVYEIQLFVSNAYGSDTISTTIEVLASPQINLGADTVLCTGDSLTIAVNDPATTFWEWSTGETAASITISTPGTYWVQAFNGLCSAEDAITIGFEEPIAYLGPDQPICEGESITLSSSQNGATYLWQDGSVDPTYEASEEGWYFVEVRVGECYDIDSMFLSVNPLPVVDLGPDTMICPNTTLILDVFTEEATYLWSDASLNPSLQVSLPGVYSVEVDLNGCTAEDEIEVKVIPAIPPIDIGADSVLCLGFEMMLNANAQFVDQYIWSNGEFGSSTVVSETGSYFVVAANECETINSNIVHVTFKDCNCYFWMPNVFSPNYDGINDEFSPFSDCEVLKYKLNIFNRWGDFVFESTDVRLGWDGTFRGESANIGVYTYFIEATLFRNGVQEKINMEGDVTLIR